MEKNENKRLARVCILAAAITLGSAWHVSGAQADAAAYDMPEAVTTEEWESEAGTGKISAQRDSAITIAQTPEEAFTYQELDGGSIEITGFNGEQTGDVVIPSEIDGKKVTSIGRQAFENCSSLTSVTIPKSVTSIAYGAFAGCFRLTAIEVESGNYSYFSQNGVLFSGQWLVNLLVYPVGKKEEAYQIPEGVTSIEDNAFSSCSSLVSVTMPESVTSIGWYAFSGCSSLVSVTMPESLTSIGRQAFENCSSLESIEIPEGMTTIEYGTFRNCSSLESIEIPEGVTTIEYWTFNGCNSLVNVALPESLKSIGNNAFSSCSSLASVTIPKSVTHIGSQAFYHCSILTSIEIPDGVTSIEDWTFGGCSILTSVTIPESVTSIADSAFWGCSSLASVTIPKSVTSIADNAFFDCSSLTGIAIPKGVASIGEAVFAGCFRLTAIEVASDNNAYFSKNGILFSKKGAEDDGEKLLTYPAGKEDAVYQIPGSVTSIASRAFYHCSNLTGIELPGSVTSIGDEAFVGCDRLTAIKVANGNDSYSSQNGILFNGTGEELLVYPVGKEETVYAIPGSVKSIGKSAFSECVRLSSIIIPESVTSIGYKAFAGCSRLGGIAIPDSVTDIGNYAFMDCSSLASIKMPNGLTSIGEGVFSYCSSLTSIEIPDGVTSIGHVAFNSCALTRIDFPEGLTSIGSSAFSVCRGLTSVAIPESVTSIEHDAFFSCRNLTSIVIPKSVTDIGADVFFDCPLLAIYCDRDSAAEAYAKKYNIPYRYIGESGDTETPGGNSNPPGSTGGNQVPETPGDTENSKDTEDTESTEKPGNAQTPGKPDSGKQPGGISDAGTKKPQTITAKNITKTYGAKAFSLGAKASGGGKLSYSVSNPKVAAVSKAGKVTIKGCGVTKIKIKAAATGTYAAAEKTITLTVKAKKQTITAKNLTKAYGAKAFSLGAKASGGGKLSYTVSDKKVAAVSKTGRVTIKGCGVTKIKIKAAASKNHAAAAKTITLTVKPKQQKISSLKSQKAKTLTVKWKKDAKATGYILQYSTDKKFKKAVKTVTVKKNGTTAKTLSKLNGGKKYYVRVCSYKTSGGKSIKGAYSPAKAATVKK